MSKDAEKTTGKRRKKKSKIAYYAYAILILVLTISNLGIGLWLLTYVQKIEVVGNVIGEKSEIVSWIQEDPLTINSVYTYYKYQGDSYQLPIYLERVDVTLKAPWKVQVKVKEKEIVACIAEGRAYVYFDKDGLVLKKTSVLDENVPLIEGATFQNTGQFAYMQEQDEKTLECIVNLVQELAKTQINPDRILWDEEGMNLYFGDIRVQLGTNKFNEKIVEVPPVLEKLPGKKGIIHLEHYVKGGIIRFEENT